MEGPTTLEAGFRDFGTGERFWIEWSPAHSAPEAALFVLPPFGEEMNKCRRAVASAARGFAAAGFRVRAVDCLGTGDSPGDFEQATWNGWIADLAAAARDLREELPLLVWAIRGGSLLARHVSADGALLWQPVLSGEQQLLQLLRLKVANENFAGRAATGGTRELRAQLEAGEPIEVAGYRLPPRLALPMARERFDLSPPWPEGVAWFETGTATEPPPATARVLDGAREKVGRVRYAQVDDEPFWMTLEIAEANRMAAASLEWLRDLPVARTGSEAA